MLVLVFVHVPKQARTLIKLSPEEKAGRPVLFLLDDQGFSVWIRKHFKLLFHYNFFLHIFIS